MNEAEKALCAWADKLTTSPQAMTRSDADQLRAVGWSDREIHDACQVVAYFNYVNRLADGLGVDAEDWLA
ncbi:MAG: peroxidase [Planctomycetes bacterium]|nr:peroxidase [Planctomycetota bacterium]MBT4029508.1 peroxidase [Planctomycetota bacterium]MBT4560622.1 peroxidase [Planctomycetota bacterium]MBT5102307.1 peroxidase [Planctomycetota bacterium]MBT5119527.1 peroxidase [Planctomycetota bacterium]